MESEDSIPGVLQDVNPQLQIGDDVNVTTEGMETHAEYEISENHFNSGEVSDEVSGGGSEDAIPGGLQDVESQQPMGDDVNATTEGMETLAEYAISENHFNSREVSDDPRQRS